MLRVFQICFLTGVLYAIVSFILGQLLDFMDIDGDIDIPGDLNLFTVSPLKPIIITAFVIVFGGIGTICIMNKLNSILSSIIATSSGLLVSFIIYRFVVIPLYRAQNTSAISQSELIGSTGKLILAIKGNYYGTIRYTRLGNTYTSPAKSINGEDIEKGEAVIIMEIKNNIYYVKKI